MYKRIFHLSSSINQSVFLFGPRGTGKTTWIKQHLKDILYFDLLESGTQQEFLANPSKLESRIPKDFPSWIVIDEIQKAPALLNEVHRLIEIYGYKFILTGSSARSLRRKGVDLLGGRALDFRMHPLTCNELGEEFSLEKALQYGLLPSIYHVSDPQHYLETYISSYLREEVLQEGLARNIGEFARFLEVASFSQGEMINYSEIGRESNINRKTVTSYFSIVEDLLIGFQLPVFSKRAKRKLVSHPKFYFFDAGVYRTLRPKGPLDLPEEIDGPVLETLFLQHLRALNDYYRLGYKFYYWRTTTKAEVDIIAYGENGLIAFEIKRKRSLAKKDLKGLKLFGEDYEMAKLYMIYGGSHEEYHDNIHCIPFEKALFQLKDMLK